MSQRKHSTLIDPDPFTTAMAVLTVVSTAAGVCSASVNIARSRKEAKGKEARRKANVHRWEAEVIDLKALLSEFSEFTQEVGVGQPHFGATDAPALQPFQTPIQLGPQDYTRYKKYVGKLLQQAKKLNSVVFDLVPDLDDEQTVAYLENQSAAIRNEIAAMKNVHSLAGSLDRADSVLDTLLKIAEYLREGVL
jgi:hypothetical protein